MSCRSLLVALLLVAAIPTVEAAGEAIGCPVDSEAVAAVARSTFVEVFTRPESGVRVAKRTTCGHDATAQDAYEMVMEAPDKGLFIDGRTRAELQFIGRPTLVDAHVRLLVETSRPQWDEANSTFKRVPNPKFVEGVGERFAQKKLTRDHPVILICRCGVRAARAANVLTQAGYTEIYKTIDGFEGDPVAEGTHKGERLVNGWRNAGLPWTARLVRAKMYELD